MIINFHEHPQCAELNMKKYNIDKSVLLPVGEDSLNRAIYMSQNDPERFIPFIWINDLNRNDLEEYVEEYAKEFKCKGIKFQPLLQHFLPSDPRLLPVYKKAQDLGIVVLFHCGIVNFPEEFGIPHFLEYANPLPDLDRVAWNFPELKIVISHMGGNYFYEAIVLAEKRKNICLDTSYLHFFCDRFLPYISPEHIITHSVKIIGANRILYGCEGVDPEIILKCDIADKEKRLILGENAQRILGI